MVTMNRRTVLKAAASAAALLSVPMAAWGQTRPKAADELLKDSAELNGAKRPDVVEVAKNLLVISSWGGNIAIITAGDGPLMVDAGLEEHARLLVASIKDFKFGRSPVLINTHHHYDHTGGNEALNKAGFRIVAHANVRKWLSEKRTIDFFQKAEEPSPESARPTVTFEDELKLYTNGETILLKHMPPSHTDGDTVVVFEKAGVVHTGDLFFNAMYPFIDYSAGGSLDGMIAVEETILKMVDDKMKIIPGHGAVCGKADLQAEIDMLKKVRDAIKPLVDGGKTEAEVLAAKPLAMFEGKYDRGFLNDESFAKLVYRCYTWKKK